MLDTFEILTTSGIVLWSKSYAQVSANIINSLITEVFIEERGLPNAGLDGSSSTKPTYKKDQYTLKWTTARDLGLIFVAVYQSLLNLSWIDKLLDNVKTLFVSLYGSQLKRSNTSIVDCPFDDYFDQQVRELEKGAGDLISRSIPSVNINEEFLPDSARENGSAPPPLPGILRSLSGKPIQLDPANEATETSAPTSRSASPSSQHLLKQGTGPGGRTSRRARKSAQNLAPSSTAQKLKLNGSAGGKDNAKRMRKWDADGMVDEEDDTRLDFSAPSDASPSYIETSGGGVVDAAQHESAGKRTSDGDFILRDLDEEVHSILSSADSRKAHGAVASGITGSTLGGLGSLFRNIVGGKTLTKADLDKPIKGLEEHLIKKNVAPEAASKLCEGVEQSLIGAKTGSFQSIEAVLRTAMESSLRKILTPTSSLDLLRDIQSVTAPSALSSQKTRPYVISVVGVNGVGKSTNLSKICFFLLQNKHRVLIAACDTFRSGAVEQLRVHARNLKELSEREGGHIELYEKGYGKDAANIAKDAVAYANANNFSVVLIDTAGRRHNDARLMSSLEKFAAFARPDKILMVGEALVGTDSVQQARNFNAAFGQGRGLDGFIISKCDTVGDMVGTLVSMVFATGIPVLFVGTGQHYTDLRTLSVSWAVRLLMS